MSELKDVSGGEWRFPNKAMKLSASVYAAEVIGQKDRRVSWCYGNSPEEALANARLMAAAKDMAEALRKLRDRYLSLVDSGDCGHWKARDEQEMKDADAALKKAGAA